MRRMIENNRVFFNIPTANFEFDGKIISCPMMFGRQLIHVERISAHECVWSWDFAGFTSASQSEMHVRIPWKIGKMDGDKWQWRESNSWITLHQMWSDGVMYVIFDSGFNVNVVRPIFWLLLQRKGRFLVSFFDCSRNEKTNFLIAIAKNWRTLADVKEEAMFRH